MNEFNDTTKAGRTSEDVDRFAESYNKTNDSPSDSITSSGPTDEVKLCFKYILKLAPRVNRLKRYIKC